MAHNIYDIYRSYVDQYTSEYGDNTVVFIQVGSFYEIYDDGSNTVDIKSIAELLNILVSKRNKNIPEVSRNNVLMAGVPIWAKQKYFNVLVTHNYTVVLVEQVTDPPNPVRKVTEILSPGLPLEVTNHYSNHLATIFIEEEPSFHCAGFATLDVFTGKSHVFECHGDQSLDELYRLVSTYQPREIVIFGHSKQRRYQEIRDYLDFGGSCKFHNKLHVFDENLIKMSYIETLLGKIYPHTGMLSPIEYINLERRPAALAAFAYLLNFAFLHNETVLKRMDKPIVLETRGNLHLSYNAAKKLDILQAGYGLLALLNTCATSMGKRLFRDRILNPIADVSVLNASYDAIEELIQSNTYLEKNLALKEIYDLEHLYRKISTGKLQPFEWRNIHMSMIHACKLCESDVLKNETQAFMDFYASVIDLALVEKYTYDTVDASFFCKGVYKDIDVLQEKLEECLHFFESTVKTFNVQNEFFKLDTNEREGYHITVTSKRFKEFQNSDVGKNNKLVQEIIVKPVSSSSAIVKLFHSSFDQVNKDIVHVRQQLRAVVLSTYSSFLDQASTKYHDVFQDLVNFISCLDVQVTNAKNAVRYGYCKPCIFPLSPTDTKSYVDIKEVRHPLIERLISTDYVANDVCLGKEADGLLLYGTNATGKSSLGKSVALAIIMAQSRMFVPACTMRYYPYQRLFARIPTGDDMQRGHSTFVVEMLELRNILAHADANSFCISDELCNGTESISGVGIVGAVIETLCERRCSFITASHLHEIVDISSICALKNLRICHLEVRYDEASQVLIYDRKLKEGSGSSIYGLEVCRSLALPDAFLIRANQIRRDVIGTGNRIVKNKTSRYNANVFVDACEICGSKSEEIHHIKPQMLADRNGMIGSIHQNHSSNLTNVCAKCHDKVHNGDIIISGYSMTDQGKKLLYKTVERESSDDVTCDIMSMMHESPAKSQAEIIKRIQAKHPHVTKYRIQKIIKSIKENV